MQSQTHSNAQRLLWAGFMAILAAGVGFSIRAGILGQWAEQYGFTMTELGQITGGGLTGFGIIILLSSLIADKVGYGKLMAAAFITHFISAVLTLGTGAAFAAGGKPAAYWCLFIGMFLFAIGNGICEAVVNPLVATLFPKKKTHYLNILHAGWPGGLVIAGIAVILMGGASWETKLGLIFIPAIIYLVMLIRCEFPVQERVAAGVSYRDMLAEFGFGGAAVVSVLMFLQLDNDFPGNEVAFMILCGAAAVALGVYTKSLGRPLMFVLILLMTPLATTEIGTDGWISGIMANAVTFHAGWILVYTSVIMMVLRFYAGPIVHRLQPLPLLILSCILAIAGLFALSGASGVGLIFAAATLYALGKTFFWPTMLGIVSEQTPKGGALTLNSVSGIGMLAVGVLGFPYIGALQARKEVSQVASLQQSQDVPGLVVDGNVSADLLEEKSIYYGTIDYPSLKGEEVEKLLKGQSKETKEAVETAQAGSAQKALANMTIFPLIMLITYILLYLYFRSKGGYKPLELSDGAH